MSAFGHLSGLAGDVSKALWHVRPGLAGEDAHESGVRSRSRASDSAGDENDEAVVEFFGVGHGVDVEIPLVVLGVGEFLVDLG